MLDIRMSKTEEASSLVIVLYAVGCRCCQCLCILVLSWCMTSIIHVSISNSRVLFVLLFQWNIIACMWWC